MTKATIDPARDILREALEPNPGATRIELRDLMMKPLRKNDEALSAIIDCWLAFNHTHVLRELLTANMSAEQRMQATTNRDILAAARRLTETKMMEAKAAAIKEAVLLDTVLSNGKTLRKCTKEEIAAEGGWLTRVAARLRPGQKGSALSEGEVRQLYMRSQIRALAA